MLCRGIFPPFGQKWTKKKDRSFSALQSELHPQSLYMPKSKGICGLIENTFFLLQEFNDNGICLRLCNYSQGCFKAPDMGVCSRRHGKPTEVEGKLLR